MHAYADLLCYNGAIMVRARHFFSLFGDRLGSLGVRGAFNGLPVSDESQLPVWLCIHARKLFVALKEPITILSLRSGQPEDWLFFVSRDQSDAQQVPSQAFMVNKVV